ncbi:MAG: hypothetical protein LBW85_14135 [Deltaproteobacteria bacterium]|jgi:Asp-tRNA(Asn)/Glu-tRNA(Gln) amidotransferase A subunit family amidase|nr:hypothetical protein [Deltaproteobacteria bacterium]
MTMLITDELDAMFDISSLLAGVLDFPGAAGMPPDVTEAVRAAKKQMEDLPGLIEDLNLAWDRHVTLSAALGRMSGLAKAAGSEAGIPDEARSRMDEEFKELAMVVAAEAGRSGFAGTSLSLATRPAARAAAKVLAYLEPVIDNLDHDLKGQKALILEAIAETVTFMGIVATCYPDAEGIEPLKRTLEKVRLPKDINGPVTISPTLH